MDLLHNTRKFDPDLLELMDRPDPSTTELARALINLQKLNRHFGSHRIIRHFLNRWLKPGETLTILDACTGFGDIPRLLVEWARRRGSQVKVLAVDMQPATLEIARQRSTLFPEISYAQADVRSFEPGERFDIVLCSLALHHFAWREAVEILERLSRLGDRAVVADDRHVLVVVIRCLVAIVMAAGHDHAVVGKWIDHDDLIVDDRVPGLVQLLLPLAESIAFSDSLRMDDTEILRQRRISLLMLLGFSVVAAAVDRGEKGARRLWGRHRAAHEQRPCKY